LSSSIEDFTPSKADVILSAVLALFFPLLAGFLLGKTGALIPMILYYGLAWGISKWRRGRSGYIFKNLAPPPLSFYINVLAIILALIVAYMARQEFPGTAISGIVFTALVWAVANASSEQLLWIYIFDSWDLYRREKSNRLSRYLRRVVGLILFSVFVGTIHSMYWGRFLHTVDAGHRLGVLFIIATSVTGYLHIIVWRQSRNMIYTFIPHFMLNLFPLFWTGYSIVPFLLKT
jgi:hypothetical protein